VEINVVIVAIPINDPIAEIIPTFPLEELIVLIFAVVIFAVVIIPVAMVAIPAYNLVAVTNPIVVIPILAFVAPMEITLIFNAVNIPIEDAEETKLPIIDIGEFN
jgi:hypothetical protein